LFLPFPVLAGEAEAAGEAETVGCNFSPGFLPLPNGEADVGGEAEAATLAETTGEAVAAALAPV
jgi:hypothetical protein